MDNDFFDINKIPWNTEYIPKELLVPLGISFIIRCNNKRELIACNEKVFKATQGALVMCLESYAMSLSFETLKDQLKKQSIEQIYSDKYFREFYEQAEKMSDDKLKSRLESVKGKVSSPEAVERLEAWKTLKKEFKKQVPEAKNFNDYDIIKILRDCFVHNNESGDNYQKREDFDEYDFSFLLNKQRHNFKVDKDLVAKSFDLLSFMNNTLSYWHVSWKDCHGFIYGDFSIEDTDYNQILLIKKMEKKYPNLKTKAFAVKNNSISVLLYIEIIRKELSNLEYKNRDMFFKNLFKSNPEIEPLGVNCVLSLLLIACMHYTMVNSKPDDMANILLKTSNSQTQNFTFDETKLFVQKLRNSIVHGRFFYNPYVGRYGSVFFYDEPRKGTPKKEFEDLDEDLQKVYSDCIERGYATKKVNQLTHCATFTSCELVTIAPALTDCLVDNKEKQLTEVVMRKFSKKHNKSKTSNSTQNTNDRVQ